MHCIVWAKHLFNQLFGEADPDEDVSPDTEDPEASGEDAGKKVSVAHLVKVLKEMQPELIKCNSNSKNATQTQNND